MPYKTDDDLRAENAPPCEKMQGCLRPGGHSGKCLLQKRDRPPAGTVTPIRKSARSLEARIDGFFAGIGSLLYPFDQVCGGAILEQSGELASALDALARENPKVKQSLERMLAGGAWSGVVLAAAPIAFAIAGHHVLPMFGKPMPSSPAVAPHADTVDAHRPVPPGQQARQEAGWNEAFSPDVEPSEVFGGPGGA